MTTSGPAVGQQGIEPEPETGLAPVPDGRVILLVGPPGAGQPTLGRLLEELGLPVVGSGVHAEPSTDIARDHDPASVVVLAWRSPEATVAALATEGVVPVHAVALWEAHLVDALRGASGLPLFGLDVDQVTTALPRLAEFLTGLGITVPGDAVDGWRPAAAELEAAASAHGSAGGSAVHPELAALTEAIRARLAPVLAAAAGAHPTWEAPDDLALGPTSEALLGAHRAAHRAALDAVAAWAAVHEAEQGAQDAKAAVEREHRELVGPDPLHYLELRRELWRLRDEFAGIVAGRTNYHTAWMRADAARLANEQRVADLLVQLDQLTSMRAQRDELRRERDEILGSERWRIGGLVLSPFTRLRRSSPRR
jgi:hypothetical protein